MTQQGRIVGIDVAKTKADVCIRSLGLRLTRPSTPQGQAEVIAWLRQHAVTVAVMEASGGYERAWAAALRQAGIVVRVVDPKRVRNFARSAGRQAKNDLIDAQMIAWFAETFADAPVQPEDAERDELDRLVTARAALVKMATQIGNQTEHEQPRVVERAFAAMARMIAKQLARLDAAIAAKIAAVPAMAARAALIQSVPGLAGQAAAGLIAWMPELGRIGRRPAAALLGAAPYDDDSGSHVGQRHIKGGRRELRDLLYMVTLGAATRHNPVLKAYYQRLRAKGKKSKVALIACMRKLIVVLNAMLTRGEPWNAARHQQSVA